MVNPFGGFKRLGAWLAGLVRRGPSGRKRSGVDAGRHEFAGLDDRDRRHKQNLIRKINQYRLRQKAATAQSFKPESRSWSRGILLTFGLAASVILLVMTDSVGKLTELLEDVGYFHITRVEVRGCRNSDADTIRASSGIRVSSSLLALDEDAVSRAVRHENGWVKQVRLVRRWPDEVSLQVEEYQPIALIASGASQGGALWYLDRQGTAFVEVEAGMDLDYPVLTGLEVPVPEVRQEVLEEALALVELLRRNNPNLPSQSVSEIHLDPKEGLVVHMVEYPFPIFFGSGEVREKYYRLRRVMEELYKFKPSKNGMAIAQVAYIRLDYLSDKVIVGYRSNTESG